MKKGLGMFLAVKFSHPLLRKNWVCWGTENRVDHPTLGILIEHIMTTHAYKMILGCIIFMDKHSNWMTGTTGTSGASCLAKWMPRYGKYWAQARNLDCMLAHEQRRVTPLGRSVNLGQKVQGLGGMGGSESDNWQENLGWSMLNMAQSFWFGLKS